MNIHSQTLGTILNRTVYAVLGRNLSVSTPIAAEVFLALLDYHGLSVVSHCGLVADGDIDNPDDLKLVKITDDGMVEPPTMKLPLAPEQAHQLGVALIGGAKIAMSHV